MEFRSLRGFRDIYPEQMAARRNVLDRLMQTCRKFGLRDIDCPSVESLEMFKLKSGPDIVNETWSFADKSGREVTLVPELTPTISRMIASRSKELARPIRWCSVQKFWRYEEPQSGRLREFYQLNCDIFGVEGVEADAEIVALACQLFLDLGLTDQFELRISDRRLLEGCLRAWGATDLGAVTRIVDKRSKLSRDDFVTMLGAQRLGKTEVEKLDRFLSVRGPLAESLKDAERLLPDSGLANEGLARLRQLAELIESYGVSRHCVLDLSIVRGLDYYTSMVFEAYDRQGELRALFGGGRYDRLVEMFGGESTPAVGFAMGDAVLELLLRRSKLWPEERLDTDYFVVWLKPEYGRKGLELVTALRASGCCVEYDLLGRSFAKQMKYADRIGAQRVLILGEAEMKAGKVSVKDMKSGKQEMVDLASLPGAQPG